jgi:WD40 repeat protein
LSGSVDGTVRKWDVKSGVHSATLHITRLRALQRCCFCEGGRLAVTVSDPLALGGGYEAHVWNCVTGELQFALPVHQETLHLVNISPLGQTIVTCSFSFDKHVVINVWNAATGQLQRAIVGTVCPGEMLPLSCSISPDEGTIVTTTAQRTLRLWDVLTGHLRSTLKGHTGMVVTSTFSPNGKTIVSSSEDRSLKLWDAETHELKCTLKGHRNYVWGACYSPDGTTLFSVSADRSLNVWG